MSLTGGFCTSSPAFVSMNRGQSCVSGLGRPACFRRSMAKQLSSSKSRRKSESSWGTPENRLRVTAMMGEGELDPEVQEGKRIRVTQEITIFHAPKHKEGLQLKDLEGTVKQIVKKFQGKELSANLPYRIEFILEKEDAKNVKFFAHMDASEFDVLD